MQTDASSTAEAPASVAALHAHAQQLRAAGQTDAAAAAWRALLALVPGHPEASNEVGLMELQLGASPALVNLAMAVRGAPEQEKFWLDYIAGLIDSGDRDAAAKVIALGSSRGLRGAALDALAARLPRVSKTQVDAAMHLLRKGKLDEAFNAAGQLALDFPGDSFGRKIQSAVLCMRGQFGEALVAMQQGLRSDPSDAEVHANLGSLYNDLKRRPEAAVAFRRALALRPDEIATDKENASVWNGLGVALHGQSRQAEEAFRRALALDPTDPEILSNLGVTLIDQGRLAEAVLAFEKALLHKPTFYSAHSSLLFCLSHFDGISPAALFDAHRKFGIAVESSLHKKRPSFANTPAAQRVIRVGFVSGDFRAHALASFFEPLAASLAKRDRMELFAYFNYSVEDNVSARLQSHIPRWLNIFKMSDREVADRIRADGIDILIDMSSHTGHNRLPMFAQRPAPLQASWMAYPGTTGLSTIDYYLTDIALLPERQYDGQFTESLVRLPQSVPFKRSADAPAVSALPAVENGFVTFGSFNRRSKISREVVSAWGRLLRALPTARLLLAAMPEEDAGAEIAAWLLQEKIEAARVDFHQRGSMQAYLALHQQVDVCVDTFPYSGATTTLHALTMGVPTLTIAGGTAAGRQSACVLEGHGLQRFVAKDIDDFVARGVAIAGATAQLARERASLRSHFPDGDVNDIELISDSVESALRTMWQRWCAGLPAAPFTVPAGSSGTSLDELVARANADGTRQG